MKNKILILGLLVFTDGCTVVSYDRVFPKLAWAWTAEAKEQRKSNEEREQAIKEVIPNFKVVDAVNHIYRGGQPDTSGFDYLTKIGVTHIVKLNLESEGRGWKDEDYSIGNGGYSEGMAQARVTYWCAKGTNSNWGEDCYEISYLPITLKEQLIGDPKWMAHAVRQLQCFTNNYVHCEHGQDRTGLVVACYRVKVNGWTKEEAEKEMLENGFHKELYGLWKYWKEFPNQDIWKQW